jgi:hypothetical protein
MINKISCLMIAVILWSITNGEELPKAVEQNRDKMVKVAQPKWEMPRR